MEASERVEASVTTLSPCARYIAGIANGKVRLIHAAQPERSKTLNTTIPPKDITAFSWSADSDRIALLSSKRIEVLCFGDQNYRVRIDNGSGGLGRFVSAAFINTDTILTIWEFGRAKLWNLSTGKGIDYGDLKSTCNGSNWQQRPPVPGREPTRSVAMLSRSTAEDILTLHFPNQEQSLPSVKLPTIDAQSVSWSPDGRWLAILDTPTANPSVHFYTADGHLFRSISPTPRTESFTLGVKSLIWSGDSRMVGLSRYDGTIVLLSARTFAAVAVVEHASTIDQSLLAPEQRALIWREALSAAGERSYSLAPQPVSPPLSRSKPSDEPSDLGVAEACFSCDGSYLASRDERMLSTVWIWSMATLSAHAVVLQHGNVRKMLWHPTKPDVVMLDCGEGFAYLFDVTAFSAPAFVPVSLPGTATLSWLVPSAEDKIAILAATRSAFRVVYPEGRDSLTDRAPSPIVSVGAEAYEDGVSEDSLLDVLSGRKMLPPKTEPSYTEMVDLEANKADEEDHTVALDDTFRGKRAAAVTEPERDPLDDSQIF
ncbi:hypothetical protein BAUCODRAFT_134006 [Baudoinia panamericana UAMH 10762]|uniref:Uncharacterized protein n=1 Tax=Baudoinia panamericana (strain UAMH 10762) TaxID=717646 RepID=M2ML41_BAUPA|nr:uncharacterized protein BAUCODRAFT_134006 [Baudoinia panamericana UAMH 10762]EMC92073.1 hypothetical protein BAUCODRAFT_134006 [Baudoinia panamericana UAMH 10762]